MTEVEAMKLLPPIEKPSNSNVKHSEEWFKVKHIYPIGRFSTLVLMINIKTLEHVTFQSIDRNTKNDILQRVKSEPLFGHEFILQFIEETFSHENSRICWIIYENCICSIVDYLSIMKSPNNSVGLFFGTNLWNNIFTDDSKEYDFDCRKIFINFVQELFHVVDSLKEIHFDGLFDLDNILITDLGKLKIFPFQNDSKRKNKHPEDIALEGHSCRGDFSGFDALLQSIDKGNLEQCENSEYLRNLLEAGLISTSLLFRGWSPFRISDLNHTQKSNLNLSPTQLTNINQDVWFLQTIYDPSIHQDFIIKGFTEMMTTADEELRIVLESLTDVFQPRINRKLNMEKLKILKLITNLDLEKDLLLKYLHRHYLLEQSNEPNRSRKRRFNQSFSNSVNNSVRIPMNECDCDVDNDNEGVANWLDDGPAFQKLSQGKEFETKNEESICDNNLKGIANWIDGGNAFQDLPRFTNLETKSSTTMANKKQCEHVETLEGISNWIQDKDDLKTFTDFDKLYSVDNKRFDGCDCEEQDADQACGNTENYDFENSCGLPFPEFDESASCSSSSEVDESILSKVVPTMSSFFNMIYPCSKSNLPDNCDSIELPKDVIIFSENNPYNLADQQCEETQNSNIGMSREEGSSLDLQRIIPSAKSVRLSIKSLPKPIIASHSKGLCNIYYNFDTQLGGLYLDEIPESIVHDNAMEVGLVSGKLSPIDYNTE